MLTNAGAIPFRQSSAQMASPDSRDWLELNTEYSYSTGGRSHTHPQNPTQSSEGRCVQFRELRIG